MCHLIHEFRYCATHSYTTSNLDIRHFWLVIEFFKVNSLLQTKLKDAAIYFVFNIWDISKKNFH